MSLCSIPTSITSSQAGRNQLFPQFGQGQYMGIYYPGSQNRVVSSIGAFTQVQGFGAELVIQNDTNFISSLSASPQNVLRLTGQNGISYIQGSNIAFANPYSGNVGVRILPSTNQINVNKLGFVSSLQVSGSGNINMIQLVSTIGGYGWANVS